MVNDKKLLTIVTVVKNGESTISDLINSINNQSSNNFYWLIIDGGSSDKTVSIIKQTTKSDFKIVYGNDFSIYHAMNIALTHIETEYYVVAGSDDQFNHDFVSNFEELNSKDKYDLIIGNVSTGAQYFYPTLKNTWLNGCDAPHSIGTVIRTRLHLLHGDYSNFYPVVADKLFLKKSILGGAKVVLSRKNFGIYSQNGMSSRLKIDYVCDLFRMQLASGENFFVQFLILLFRLLKIKLR